MTGKTLKPSRRGFLLGAGTSGAAAVAAVVASKADLPKIETAPSAPEAPVRGGGYHLSEHVARYYRSAKV